MISTVITFAVVLSLLVLVHELGHFISARRAGVRVEEFGFGFPPRLAGVKRGGTIYSINWIPLGGFVRLKGEAGDSRDRDSFSAQPARKRAVILAAGVVMNLVLAWALLSVGYMIGLPQVIDDETLPSYATTSEERIQIVSVLDGAPAEEAGFEAGDRVIAVDGETIGTIEEFSAHTGGRGDVPITVTVEREDGTVDIAVAPMLLERTGRPGIGVGLIKTGIVRYPVFAAPVHGLVATVSFTTEIVRAFGQVIGELLTGAEPSVEFSGPVGIAVITGEVARLGLRYLLQFTALLSVNLAIINVLPIPALDGGRLLFLAIEKLRGRSVNARFETAAHNIGFALLILLVLVVTYGDVVRFGDRIMKALVAVFTG